MPESALAFTHKNRSTALELRAAISRFRAMRWPAANGRQFAAVPRRTPRAAGILTGHLLGVQ